MRWTRIRPTIFLKIMLIVSLITMFAAWLVTRNFPDYRYLIIDEDQLVENLTAVFFFAAFLLALVFFLKLWRVRKHAGLAAVSIVALAGFLDEISFGERLFDLSMPWVGGVKVDAVHDVIELAYVNFGNSTGFLIAVVIGISVATLWIFWRLLQGGGRNKGNRSFHPWSDPSTYFVLVFVFFLSASILIDMDLFHTSTWYRRLLFSLEEVFEMNASLALFFFSFYLYESAFHEGVLAADANSRRGRDSTGAGIPQVEPVGSESQRMEKP